VIGWYLGKFRVTAVHTSLEVGRGDEEVALDWYYREGGGPKVAHAGEDDIFDKVDFLTVGGGAFGV
jgi:hypothetical protein